jgi:hypothetical protein
MDLKPGGNSWGGGPDLHRAKAWSAVADSQGALGKKRAEADSWGTEYSWCGQKGFQAFVAAPGRPRLYLRARQFLVGLKRDEFQSRGDAVNRPRAGEQPARCPLHKTNCAVRN